MRTYTLRTAFTSLPGLTAAECEVEAAKIMAADPDAAPYMVPEPPNSLADLLAAMKVGEFENVTAWLDNDNVSFVDGGENTLLSLHPYEVQEQALAALGITTEAV